VQSQERQPLTDEYKEEESLVAWKYRWQVKETAFQEQREEDVWAKIERLPDPAILRLHTGLRKAQSTVLVHLRTGRIGLRHFLKKARVPGYELDQCECGIQPGNPKARTTKLPRRGRA